MWAEVGNVRNIGLIYPLYAEIANSICICFGQSAGECSPANYNWINVVYRVHFPQRLYVENYYKNIRHYLQKDLSSIVQIHIRSFFFSLIHFQFTFNGFIQLKWCMKKGGTCVQLYEYLTYTPLQLYEYCTRSTYTHSFNCVYECVWTRSIVWIFDCLCPNICHIHSGTNSPFFL